MQSILIAGAEEIADFFYEYFPDSLAGPHAVIHDAFGDFQSYAEVAAECGDVAMATDLDGGRLEIVREHEEPLGVAVDAHQVLAW